MLMALLKGKLSREQENMEDILTSNVFGLLKYRPEEVALLPFLRLARTPEDVAPLADLPNGKTAEYEFWPKWSTATGVFCQPDVVLRLTVPDGPRKLVLIEAKYRSGKSGEADYQEETPPNDQLAKEWDSLAIRAQKEGAEPFLLYLTADIGRPSEEIEASQTEYRQKYGGEAKIVWISWRHLEACLLNTTDPILQDLRQVLWKLELYFFGGFTSVGLVPHIAWSFQPPSFNWSIGPIRQVDWRFFPGTSQ